jgi:hypothetical protein
MTRDELSASRLARLHQMYSGPIPKRLLDWAQRGEPPHVEWRRRWAAARATLASLDAQLPAALPGVVYNAQAGWRREARHCATMYARTKREFA